jgi:hypothetical protein
MATFPRLKTGAVLQYPATRTLRFGTQVMRFVDGSEQSYRTSGAAARRWEIRLEALDEGELAEIDQFFAELEGQYGSFAFTDPWDGTEYADCGLEQDELEITMSGEMRGRTSLVVRENKS